MTDFKSLVGAKPMEMREMDKRHQNCDEWSHIHQVNTKVNGVKTNKGLNDIRVL